MKTLFERLKPEIVTPMELEAEQYPATVEMLKRDFEGKNYFTELTVSCIMQLFRYTNSEKYSILELVAMFEDR